MKNILYKADLAFDEQKVVNDDKYELNTIIEVIKQCIEEEGIDVYNSSKNGIVSFGTSDKDKYGSMQVCLIKICKSNVNNYIKSFIYYNNETGNKEDVLLSRDYKSFFHTASNNINNNGVLYKITIGFDEDAINRDGYFIVNDIYNKVRQEFKDRNGINEIKSTSKGTLVFGTNKHNKYADLHTSIINLYRSNIRKYINKLEWHNYEIDSIEDVLKTFQIKQG